MMTLLRRVLRAVRTDPKDTESATEALAVRPAGPTETEVVYTSAQVAALLQAHAHQGVQQQSLDPASPAPHAVYLDKSISDYIASASGGWSRKTAVEYPNRLSEFGAWARNAGVTIPAAVTPAIMRDYRTWLQSSRNLKPRTVNKCITICSSYFRSAQLVGDFPADRGLPTSGLLFGKALVRKHSRKADRFTEADLKSIFQPTAYRAWACRPDYFWPPLLMAHTGFRVGESFQLTTADFDGDATVGVTVRVRITVEGQRVKTPASYRILPVHPSLVDLGLLDYINDVRALIGADGLLFPFLRADSINGYSDDSAPHLIAYYRQRSTQKRVWQTNHSFRHTVNDILKQAGVAEEHRCQYVGHEHDTVNSSTYGTRLAPHLLAGYIFPHLQLPLAYSELRYQGGEFDKFIKHRITQRCRSLAHASAQRKRTSGDV